MNVLRQELEQLLMGAALELELRGRDGAMGWLAEELRQRYARFHADVGDVIVRVVDENSIEIDMARGMMRKLVVAEDAKSLMLAEVATPVTTPRQIAAILSSP